MKIKNIVEKLFKVIIFYFKKVWSTFKLTKYYKENKKKIVIVLFFLVYFWISPWKFPFIINIVLWVWFITLF